MAFPSRRERLAVAALAAGAAVLALLISWSVLGLVPHVTGSGSYPFPGAHPGCRSPLRAAAAGAGAVLARERHPRRDPLVLEVPARLAAAAGARLAAARSLVDEPAAAGAGGRRRVARGPAPLRPGDRAVGGGRARLLAIRAADGGRRDGARAGPLRRGVVPGDDRRGGGRRRRSRWPQPPGHADRHPPAGRDRPAHPPGHRGGGASARPC